MIEPLTANEAIKQLQELKEQRGGNTPTNLVELNLRTVKNEASQHYRLKIIATTDGSMCGN